MRATLFIGLAVIALAGCDLLGDGYNLDVTTDKPTYTLAVDSLAQVRLVNDSVLPVFLPMGSYAYYEQFYNGEWGADRYWFVVDGAIPYIMLTEGDRLEDRLPLYFYLRNAPGRYRVVYRVYRDKDLKKLLPLHERVSAPFEVLE